MTELWRESIHLLMQNDHELAGIVTLSLCVSGAATVAAAAISLPIGAIIASHRFIGKAALVAIVNGLMGLPPVVVGLMIYLLLSRAGPLGKLGLLYTPTAMFIAQTTLLTPLLLALSIQCLQQTQDRLHDFFQIFSIAKSKQLWTLLTESKHALYIALLAAFGRAIAEVGAVMIVGGNINHVTRVMTTTIALESSKGRLQFAVALGLILISITVFINLLLALIQHRARMWRMHD